GRSVLPSVSAEINIFPRNFDDKNLSRNITYRDQFSRVATSLSVLRLISKSHVRKEAIVAKVLEQRGDHPGLVHVISAMEACDAYKPWHDKQTHKTYLRPDSGKCLHYYFYFMDAELGLIYLRVPTWARLAKGSVRRSRMEWQGEGPFRLQFYCNGH